MTLREEHRLRVFGPKRDEVTGEWRKLHNEELRDLYCLPSIIRIIKSRRMRWACSSNGEKKNAYRILVANQKEIDQWVEQDIGGNVIMKWILKTYDGVLWTGNAQWRAFVKTDMNLKIL
jgi:hypothetical protein